MSDRTAITLVLSVAIGVPVLTLVLLARAVWYAVRVRRMQLSDVEPRCGRCGYIIAPLLGGRCPECGGMLRDVGVLTPSARRRPYPLGRLALLGAASLALAVPLGRLVAPALPWSWS
jgi:hypothetical protein